MHDDGDFTFDKFMDRILIEEGVANESDDDVDDDEKKKKKPVERDDPRRRLLERYTERAHNRIRYVRK